MNIVLHEPENGANVGAIGRTCVATGTPLHLIRPYGFQLTEKKIARAGMDYWPRVQLFEYIDYEDFLSRNPRIQIWYATTKALQTYADVSYGPDDYLMFGKESAGIPEEILVRHPEQCIRIPMLPEERSLNLANSVNIILYEALRQNHFPGLEHQGRLHRLSWDI